MKVYILADGEGTRWNNWGGVPKQLIKINDETLLDRMIRLCKENGLNDITIVGIFKNNDAKNIRFSNCNDKIDLFIRIAKHSKEPFIMLNGDCYYTDAIIKDAAERKTFSGWSHWMCPHLNKYTGKPWEEGYIHKVENVEWWINKLNELKEKVDNGEIILKNGWVINNYLNNRDDIYKFYKSSNNDIYWHDETDDFDFSDGPECYSGFTNDYLRFIHHTGYKGGL
jgi:hypothetical protein